jgi:hypothetical protein
MPRHVIDIINARAAEEKNQLRAEQLNFKLGGYDLLDEEEDE